MPLKSKYKYTINECTKVGDNLCPLSKFFVYRGEHTSTPTYTFCPIINRLTQKNKLWMWFSHTISQVKILQADNTLLVFKMSEIILGLWTLASILQYLDERVKLFQLRVDKA